MLSPDTGLERAATGASNGASLRLRSEPLRINRSAMASTTWRCASKVSSTPASVVSQVGP